MAKGKAKTPPDRAWLEARYPQRFTCGFCTQEVTVSLVPKSATTRTTGHAPGCVMAGVKSRG